MKKMALVVAAVLILLGLGLFVFLWSLDSSDPLDDGGSTIEALENAKGSSQPRRNQDRVEGVRADSVELSGNSESAAALSTLKPEVDEITLVGRVVASDGGLGVENATVVLTDESFFIAKALTDPSGAFQFQTKRRMGVSLHASEGGRCSPCRWEDLSTYDGLQRIEVSDMILQDGATIFGKALSLSGQCVVGAQVTLLRFHSKKPAEEAYRDFQDSNASTEDFFVGKSLPLIDSCLSDGKGAFGFGGIPSGMYIVRASAEGHAGMETSPFYVYPPRTEYRSDLVLPPGLTLKGRIVDELGKGIADATIAWTVFDNGQPIYTKSDADGNVVLPGAVNDYQGTILISSSGFLTQGSYLDASQGDFVITLDRGSDLVGEVLDALTMKPVEGIRVSIDGEVGSGTQFTMEAQSDAEGKFRFVGLPKNEEALVRIKNQEMVLTASSDPDADGLRQRILVLPGLGGHLDPLVLYVESSATVRGSVISASSRRPVAGARVTILEAGSWNAKALSCLSTADGSFEFTFLPPVPHHLRVSHPDFTTNLNGAQIGDELSEIPSIKLTSGETAVLTLEMKQGRRIFGTVRRPDGAALPKATVRVTNWNGDSAHDDGTRPTMALSDSLGRYSLRMDNSKEAQLIASHDLYPAGGVLVVPAGDLDASMDINMNASCTLRGQILGVDGLPASNFGVCLSGRGKNNSEFAGEFRTDQEGRYALAEVPPGEIYFVDVEFGDSKWSFLDGDEESRALIPAAKRIFRVEEGRDNIHNFRLAAAITVDVTVVAPTEDVVLDYVSVYIHADGDEGDTAYHVDETSDGPVHRFAVQIDPAASYTIQAYADESDSESGRSWQGTKRGVGRDSQVITIKLSLDE